MDRKRYVFKIYHFDAKTKRLDAVETCRTKPLTEREFKKCLNRELAKKEHYCWEITQPYRFRDFKGENTNGR